MSEQQNQTDAQQDALRQRLQALSTEITPARDLWPQIAASCRTSRRRVSLTAATVGGIGRRRWRRRCLWLC